MIYSYLLNAQRKEKQVEPNFTAFADVLVIGVGTSGAFAAIGAANMGVSVIALEREERIGGMYSLGRVSSFYYGEEGGSYTEIIDEVEKLEAKIGGKSMRADSYSAVITEKLASKGVNLYTGATILGIFIKNSKVVGARALIRGKTVDISSTVVIDASSDGHIVRLCPVKTNFGRPTDGKSAPFTCMSATYDGDKVSYFNVDDGYCNQYEPFSFSDAVVRAHARKLSFSADGARLACVAPLPGVREGITFDGEERLSYTDVLSEREPERVLFYARSDFDKHGSDIALDEDEYQNFWCISNLATVTALIPVPMGSIMPRGVFGILTAGRCLSVDSYALGAVRMNRDMMRMGECVGILAALSVREGVEVRDVDYRSYISATDVFGCRRAASGEKFAFDHPRRLPGFYRPVSFNMTDDEIIAALGTESPGVAIYSCTRQRASIKARLISLLDSDNSALSLGAALALGVMRSSRALPRLRRAVRERSSAIFTGCRRSNQFKSVTAICLIGRLGTSSDIELLAPIVFDPAERERDMYLPENTPSVAYSRSSERFCYFQHFTHALMAMAKIAVKYGKQDALLARIESAFDADGISKLVDYINIGKEHTVIGESAKRVIEYAKGLLKK